MGIIVRYILRELGITLLFGFVALTSVLLIVVLVREAINYHLSILDVLKIVPNAFAETFNISLPVSLLLAVSIFFSRMSGTNETIALKSLGIPPKDFLIPVFAAAVLFSFVGVGVNELAITEGRAGLNYILYRASENTLIETLKSEKKFVTPNNQITIIVKGVDDNRNLIEPRIILKKESITVDARSAQISINIEQEMVTLKLFGIRVSGDGLTYIGKDEVIPIALSEIMPWNKRSGASSMGLDQINTERKATVEQIEQQRRLIAAHRAFAACMGSVDDWTTPQIEKANEEIRRLKKHNTKLSVESPRRWANGFSCFFFVWLGAPLAIWMRTSDFFTSFFACFVPILLLYYPLLTFGLSQAKSGALSPMCVWTANAAIGLIGLWFLRQIHRY